MNLHLIRDNSISQYFVETLVRLDLRKNNFIVCYHSSDETRFLKDYDLLINLNKDKPEHAIPGIGAYKEIYIHLFDTRLYSWIANDDRIKQFNWAVWGADVYNVPFLGYKLFLPETRKHVNRYQRENLRKLYYKLRVGPTFHKAVRKLNKVLTWMEEEFEILQSLSGQELVFSKFIYGKVNGTLDNETFPKREKRAGETINVMVGHSAVAVANHMDFLKQLEGKLDPEKYTFYIPTSYGHNNYRKFLKSECNKLSLNTVFLDDFMPLDEYSYFFSGIDYFVNNSLRPLAMGNVIMAIYGHIPVFIPEQNPLKVTLDRLGVNTLDVDSFLSTVSDGNSGINHIQNMENLRNIFNINEIDIHYRELFS